MNKSVFSYFKSKSKQIIIVTILISLAISIFVTATNKKEEIYEKENIYLIEYNQARTINEEERKELFDAIEEQLDKTNNQLSIKLDTTMDYSSYEDVVKAIIHSDQAYEMIKKNTALNLTQKQYDAMLWEEFTGNGMVLTLDIRHHNDSYCNIVGNEMSIIIRELMEKNFDANIEILNTKTSAQKVDSLTKEEENHLIDGIGHSYEKRSVNDILITGIKNFVIIGIVIFIGVLLIYSILFYAQSIKNEKR